MRNHYKNISILLVVLLYPCVLVEENIFVSLLGIKTITGQWILLINLAVIGFSSLLRSEVVLSGLQKRMILFFIFVGLYLSVIVFMQSGGVSKIFMQALRVDVKQLAIGILFLLIINSRSFDIEGLARAYINVAFAISFLSLIGYFGYLSGVIKPSVKIISSYGNQAWLDLHGLGYLNTLVLNESFGFLPRMQAYWTEPARFAQFLICPLTLAIDFRSRKVSLIDLVKLLTIVLAFLLTFSVTCYFALIIGTMLYLNSKGLFSGSKKRFGLRPLILVTIIACSWLLFSSASRQSGESIFAKDILHGVIYRYQATVLQTLDEILDNPFGNYDNAVRRVELGIVGATIGAPIVLLLKGGIVLFLFFSLFIIYIFRYAIKKGGHRTYYFYGILSFMIAISWYGNFFQYQFLFNIVLFSSVMRVCSPSLNLPLATVAKSYGRSNLERRKLWQ